MDFGELFGIFMQEYGIAIIGTLLTALFGALGMVAKSMAQKYLNNKTAQNMARIVVRGVEQMYKDLGGEEKLTQALADFSTILAEKNIVISDIEMRVLLEDAVGEFNDAKLNNQRDNVLCPMPFIRLNCSMDISED